MTNQPSIFANPYVGPRTFTRAEGNLFFGREREAQDLLALVISQRLVLFYAQSGAGKSSLINTRLIPQLQDAGFAVLPVGRVGGELPAGVTGVANIFLFNLMLSLDQGGTAPQRLAGLTLPDFLAGLASEDGENWRYEPPVPATDTTETANERGATYQEPSYVLIIDQFEEIITNHLHRWPERVAFFQALEEAMRRDPKLWVVLTLREDYVAALDPYAQLMTDKLRARFYMERMDYSAALQAVCQPALVGGLPFTEGVAETLVDNLRRVKVAGETAEQLGQYIEPVQLQVVCYQLWEKVADAIRNAQDEAAEIVVSAITAADLHQAGDVDRALADFYESALATVLAQPNLPITERRLRTWFDEALITEAGTRGTVYQGATETAGIPNRIVKVLTDQFLLRAEARAGGYWIELIHDRFVEPIQQANRAWSARNLHPIAQAAQAWIASGRRSTDLYRDRQLADALSQLESDPDQFGETERTFLRASQHAESQRKARRQRLITLGSIVLILVLVALTGWALWNAQQASRSANKAQAEATAAADARATAVTAQGEAEAAAQQARAAEGEAQHQAKLARSRQLALQSADELRQDRLEPALLLAIEAGSVTDTLEAFVAIRNAADRIWYPDIMGGHTGSVYVANWSPDGQRIVTASYDNTARIWDAATGQELYRLEGHTGYVGEANWSPDGQRIVTASYDNTARIWDAATGQELHRLEGHRGSVTAANWSPDGQRIVTASDDNTARIWDAATGQELHRLEGHTGSVTAANWSPDGQRIVTASNDNTARLWYIQLAQLREVVCQYTSRNFTWKEWRLMNEPYRPTCGNASIPADVVIALRDEIYTLLMSNNRTAASMQLQILHDWLRASGAIENKEAGTTTTYDWLKEGQLVAQSGNITQAVQAYQQAVVLDPSLALTPEAEANRQYAPTIVDTANRLAASGNITEAIQTYQKALVLDPRVEIEPETEANRQYALTIVKHANGLAALGNMTDAVQTYHRALVFDPRLEIEPETEANRQYAPTVVKSANRLAVSGNITEAVQIYQQALMLDPLLEIDPEAEANRQYAPTIVKEANSLAASGNITVSIQTYQQALMFDPNIRIDSSYLLNSVNSLAASGNITEAVQIYQQALMLDPLLKIDPEAEANRQYAPTVVSQANALAASGNITEAVQTYRQALVLDPNLTIKPEAEANRQYASAVVSQAKELAASGNITEAVQTYQHALILNPLLKIDPEVEANRQYAPTVVSQANALAASGNITEAVQTYQQALIFDSKLKLDPQQEANRQYAAALVSRGSRLASSGNITAAIQGYEQALTLDPQLGIEPNKEARYAFFITGFEHQIQSAIDVGNYTAAKSVLTTALDMIGETKSSLPDIETALCWYGTLLGEADQVVHTVCDQPWSNVPIIGSRGIARALTGDLSGALTDFKLYMSQVPGIVMMGGKVYLDPALCEAWIIYLEAGIDPKILFTEETLHALLNGQTPPIMRFKLFPITSTISSTLTLTDSLAAPVSPLATPSPLK